MAAELPQTLEYKGVQSNAAPMLELVKGNLKDNGQDFQDSPNDEEDTRDSQEYLNDLPTKDFEAKYNKFKAKLALFSSSTSSMVKNKGLVVEAYERDEKDVSSDDNEMVKVKVLMALVDDENVIVSKETESQMKVIDPLVAVTDSSVIDYDLADESSVCSTLFSSLEKLASVEHVSGVKTIKSILKSNSTFKAETLKGITINEPTSTPAKANKNISASKRNSAPVGKLKNVKTEDDVPLSVVVKELNDLKLQINKNQSSYSIDNKPQ
nr:hypothetical protein [Tanacetum cinerariifolium]